MNQANAGALICLIIGGVIAAVTVWQISRGKSYISNPPMSVTRLEDPFSFWLSIAISSAAALLFLVAGLWLLCRP